MVFSTLLKTEAPLKQLSRHKDLWVFYSQSITSLAQPSSTLCHILINSLYHRKKTMSFHFFLLTRLGFLCPFLCRTKLAVSSKVAWHTSQVCTSMACCLLWSCNSVSNSKAQQQVWQMWVPPARVRGCRRGRWVTRDFLFLKDLLQKHVHLLSDWCVVMWALSRPGDRTR